MLFHSLQTTDLKFGDEHLNNYIIRLLVLGRIRMIQDFIVPQEQIKFQSSSFVKVGGKNYRLILTNGRIVLYAQRGRIAKNEDVVMAKLSDIQGITYKEKGLLKKQGVIEIQGKTFLQLSGVASEIKPLYQQLMQFCLD